MDLGSSTLKFSLSRPSARRRRSLTAGLTGGSGYHAPAMASKTMTAAQRVRHEVRVRWLNAVVQNTAGPVQSRGLSELWRDGTQLCKVMERLQPELVLRHHKRVVSAKVAIANIELALNVLRQKSGPRFVPTAEQVYHGGEATAVRVLEQMWLAFAARPLRSKQATAAAFRWTAAATNAHGRRLTRDATRSPYELLAPELSDGVVFGLLAYAFCDEPPFGEAAATKGGGASVKLPLWSQPDDSDKRLSNLHAVWAALQQNGVELWLTPEEWLLGADEHIALVMLNDVMERFSESRVRRDAPVRFRDTPSKAQLAAASEAMSEPAAPPTGRPALSAPKVHRGPVDPSQRPAGGGARPAWGSGPALRSDAPDYLGGALGGRAGRFVGPEPRQQPQSARGNDRDSARLRSSRFVSEEERARKLREAEARLAPPKRTGYRTVAPPPISGTSERSGPESVWMPQQPQPEPEPEPESRQSSSDEQATLEALFVMASDLQELLYSGRPTESGEPLTGADRAGMEALLADTQEETESLMARTGLFAPGSRGMRTAGEDAAASLALEGSVQESDAASLIQSMQRGKLARRKLQQQKRAATRPAPVPKQKKPKVKARTWEAAPPAAAAPLSPRSNRAADLRARHAQSNPARPESASQTAGDYGAWAATEPAAAVSAAAAPAASSPYTRALGLVAAEAQAPAASPGTSWQNSPWTTRGLTTTAPEPAGSPTKAAVDQERGERLAAQKQEAQATREAAALDEQLARVEAQFAAVRQKEMGRKMAEVASVSVGTAPLSPRSNRAADLRVRHAQSNPTRPESASQTAGDYGAWATTEPAAVPSPQPPPQQQPPLLQPAPTRDSPSLSLRLAPAPVPGGEMVSDYGGTSSGGGGGHAASNAKVLFSGWLHKQSVRGGHRGGSQWDKRWFVVQEGIYDDYYRDTGPPTLFWYKSPSAAHDRTQPPQRIYSLEYGALWMTETEFALALPHNTESSTSETGRGDARRVPVTLHFASGERGGHLAVLAKFVEVLTVECRVAIGRELGLPQCEREVRWEYLAMPGGPELRDLIRLAGDGEGAFVDWVAERGNGLRQVELGMRVEAVEGVDVVGLPLPLVELRITAAAAAARPHPASIIFGIVEGGGRFRGSSGGSGDLRSIMDANAGQLTGVMQHDLLL